MQNYLPIMKRANKWSWLMVTLFMLNFISCGSRAQEPEAASGMNGTFKYAIKKFGVKAGEASLTFSEGELNGKDIYLIIFAAKAPNFFDEEFIYVDKQSLYPLMVERDVHFLGKKEKITEYYSDTGEIKIVKEAKGKTEEQILKREPPVDNIYSFLYRFRLGKAEKQGGSFILNLPTKTVKIKEAGETEISVMGEKKTALYFESDPKQYKLWFDQSPQRLPLRIDGATGLISASLVLAEVQP